jgi:hypothetical protein
MNGTDLCVNKPVTVPVIFEPPCMFSELSFTVCQMHLTVVIFEIVIVLTMNTTYHQ